MESFHEIYCLRCGSQKMKSWDELSEEQKMMAEKLPASAVFSLNERKRHLFCPLCWNEGEDKKDDLC